MKALRRLAVMVLTIFLSLPVIADARGGGGQGGGHGGGGHGGGRSHGSFSGGSVSGGFHGSPGIRPNGSYNTSPGRSYGSHPQGPGVSRGGHVGGLQNVPPGVRGGIYHGGYHNGYVGHRGGYGGGFRGGYHGGFHGSYGWRTGWGIRPFGAVSFGFFGGYWLGSAWITGWWPYYYSVPVPYGYYYPTDWYPYGAPPYVVVVPQTQGGQQPTECYDSLADQAGNLVLDQNGDTQPDFNRPRPCSPPGQQGQAATPQSGATAQKAAPTTRCFGPKVDASGREVLDQNGNLIPDYTKEKVCPSDERRSGQ